MSPTLQNLAPTLITVPVVGLVLYRRFRRTFGRQVYAPKRMMFRIALFLALAAVIATTLTTGVAIASAAFGTIVGASLGLLGLVHTRYEVSPTGKFFTPNPWIGMAITALFVGRLVARMASVYAAGPVAGNGSPLDGVQRSPATTAILFTMAAYYVVTNAGIIRAARRLTASA